MTVVHQIDRPLRPRGERQRLLREAELPRGTYQRWQARVRRGHAVYRAPGPRPPLALDEAALQRDLDRLVHAARRSHGVGVLQQRYRGQISRRDLARRVLEARRERHRHRRQRMRRIAWHQPGLVWAMDPTRFDHAPLQRVMDLASRYQFDPLAARPLTGAAVADHLEGLFRSYGPPLVLKRDNGGNLNTPEIDALLARWGVLPLNSPCAYPPFNGGIERSQREIKEGASLACSLSGCRDAVALTHSANQRPRPVLKGDTAARVFAARRQAAQPYTPQKRKEIADWINLETHATLKTMKDDHTLNRQRAYRRAVERALVQLGIITIKTNTNCYPIP